MYKEKSIRALTAALLLCCYPAWSAEQEAPTREKLEEILVHGRSQPIDTTIPTLETEKLLRLPGTMGDPISSVFSLPGVLFSGGDSGQPAVRGSAPEDNSVLIDFLPAAYIYHPFGFSIFNENVIHDFDLLAAGYPAEYGGATGAVFDITLRRPKQQPLQTVFDYSFLKTGIFFEGGITDDQAFYFSYRRSLLDLYLEEDEELEDEEGVTLRQLPVSTDYQGKYVWQVDSAHTLTVQVLGAGDEYSAEDALIDPDVIGDQSLNQNFNSQGLVWDGYYRDGSELKVALGYLTEKTDFTLGAGQFLTLRGEEVDLKARYRFAPVGAHQITIGTFSVLNETRYSFDAKVSPCTDLDPDCVPTRDDRLQDSNRLRVVGNQFYVQDAWRMLDDFTLTAGLHASEDDYLKEQLVEPRMSFRWDFAAQWALTGAAGDYHRFPDDIHVVRVIGNPDLDAPKARHYVIGLERSYAHDWSWRAELYHKELWDMALALDDDEPDAELNYVNEVSGTADGVELLVNKGGEKWYGWLSLSLARSERKNDRTGETSRFVGDTPAVANIVINYQINANWNLGGRWSYRTGAAYTPVTGVRTNPDFPELFLPVYGELNSERLPDYQRLDVRLERKFHWGRRVEGEWVVDLINATNRRNISGYQYKPTRNDTETDFRIEAEEDLEFFPSVGFKLIF
jgi:hypothetical protein